MLSYVYFGTNDLDRAIAFYSATLAPLGMKRCLTDDPAWDRVAAGWGIYEDDGVRELAFDWHAVRSTAGLRRQRQHGRVQCAFAEIGG